MSLKIVKDLVPKSKYSVKCPYTMKPTRIVVHNTANDASAKNEIAYMKSNNMQISFHYAIDDKEAVQGVLETRNTWHAGDGNGKGNREGISIEICYSKSGGSKFTKAEKNAVLLIVDILKRYNWKIDKVTKHQDYSKKYCPHRTLDLGWKRFIKMVEDELKKQDKKEMYTLLVEVPVYTSSTNALNKTNSKTTYKPGEYFVYNKSKGMINITKTETTPGGWINPEDNILKEEKSPVIEEKSPVKVEEIPPISGKSEDIIEEVIEENSYYETTEKNNPLLWLVDLLVKLVTKILGKSK